MEFLVINPVPVEMRKWVVAVFYLVGAYVNVASALLTGNVFPWFVAVAILTAALFVTHQDYSDEA